MVTPVIAKLRGLTVTVKVVETDIPLGSVAVTVTVKGEPNVVDGVPVIVLGATKLSPAGSPVTDRVRLLGVSASVKVLAGRV